MISSSRLRNTKKVRLKQKSDCDKSTKLPNGRVRLGSKNLHPHSRASLRHRPLLSLQGQRKKYILHDAIPYTLRDPHYNRPKLRSIGTFYLDASKHNAPPSSIRNLTIITTERSNSNKPRDPPTLQPETQTR